MQLQKDSILKNYEFITVDGAICNLSFGCFGSVQVAQCIKSKRLVVIKIILRLLRKTEFEVHMFLNHPNIIRLLDFQIDIKKGRTYLVLEYAENGNLFNYMKTKTQIKKQNISQIFRNVCLALNYLHSKNITHREIKPENILFDRNNTVKICSFSLSPTYCDSRPTFYPTKIYTAPEIINKKALYTPKADIWSLGILLYELIEGKIPSEALLQGDLQAHLNSKLMFSKKFKNQQMKLIQSILKIEPKQRPSIDQIIKICAIKSKQKQIYSQCSTIDQEQNSEIKIKIVSIKETPRVSCVKDKFGIQITSIKSLTQIPLTPKKKVKIGFEGQIIEKKPLKFLENQKISLRKYSKAISIKQHNI